MPTMYCRAGPPASSKKRIFIATPTYQGLSPGYSFALAQSMMALRKARMAVDIAIYAGDCHVDDARNRLVREFLTSKATDLVFIDSDVRWEPEDLVALCKADADVVGGTYPLKQENHGEPTYPVMLIGDDMTPDKEGLVEVQGLPTGFLRIKRHVLETLAAHADQYFGKADGTRVSTPLIFERTLQNGKRFGGDYTFCRKAADEGSRLYLMPELTLDHEGSMTWRGSIASTMRRRQRTTLRHLAQQIETGTDTLAHYREAREYYGNLTHSALSDMLIVAAHMARSADGPIIEAGSGLTTIVMAAATDQMVYVLEHDPVWSQRLEEAIREAELPRQNIALCLCPIIDGWYDLSRYPDIPDRFAVGLNDGPPREIGGRTPFFEIFGDRCDSILVDDADDNTFAEDIEKWCLETNRRLDYVTNRAALIRRKETPDAAT